ncbi:MAG TPA: ATP-grasp domain-containing protein, partial [bacterium]|nr:ATP-grasp domain-containing protein [bacterium]
KYDNTVMFEEYISGREVTIAVIENSGKIQTLPIIEIICKHDFFDYESKYTKGGYDYVIPAELAKELEEEIKELSIKSFRALNCKDFARLDVMIDSKTNKSYIIEINTIPGMTETSLLPKAAAAAGIAFEDLIYNFIKNNL